MMASTGALLKKLDKLLLDIPDESLPSPLDIWDPPPQVEDIHKYYRQVSKRTQQLSEYFIGKTSKLLSGREWILPFRICNIGCGNAAMDYQWLSAIIDKFPDLHIQYVGVDISKNACLKATSRLSSLKNIEVKTYDQDIAEGLNESPFDMIISVSTFYFFSSPEQVLQICKDLTNPRGTIVIILGDQDSGLELFQRFRLKEFKHEVCFPSNITAILDEMKIPYSKEIIPQEVDITECLQDDSMKQHQKRILSSFTQVDISAYPDDVMQVCVDYLRSISHTIENGDTKRVLVPATLHVISVAT